MSDQAAVQGKYVSGETSLSADGDVTLPQTINPRDTDKRFLTPGFDASDIVISYGMLTPHASTACNSRRQSVVFSQTSPTYYSDPSSATSVASFDSSSAALTPQSSISSVSSRRESMAIPGQHCQNQDMSSGLLTFPRNASAPFLSEDYRMTDPSPHDTSNTSTALTYFPNACLEQCMLHNDFSLADVNSPQMDWQAGHLVEDNLPPDGQGIQPCVLNGLCQNHNVDPRDSLHHQMQTSGINYRPIDGSARGTFNFGDAVPSEAINSSGLTRYLGERGFALGPAFEYPMTTATSSPTASNTSDDESPSTKPAMKRRASRALGNRKGGRKTRKKERQFPIIVDTERDNKCACEMCPKKFKRPEHLKRHEESTHKGAHTTQHCCIIPACGRQIKARSDNLTQHLTKTHFRYGKTEHSGKNRRISMQESCEKDLWKYDSRWMELLEGRMDFGDADTPAVDRCWKMLGYSILDTENLRIKDLALEWDGPDDMTLKQLDPRWKLLLNGTMTFDQAMDKGWKMSESEAEGVLGVNMLTTEEMGLKDLDPRWALLLSGNMDYKMAEKLGVEDYWNAVPANRRQSSKR